jgi:hypothetical protein
MRNSFQNTIEGDRRQALTALLPGQRLEFMVLSDAPETERPRSTHQLGTGKIRVDELTSTQLARLDTAVSSLIDYILSTQPQE